MAALSEFPVFDPKEVRYLCFSVQRVHRELITTSTLGHCDLCPRGSWCRSAAFHRVRVAYDDLSDCLILGKGTQCANLVDDYQFVHLSGASPDLF